LFKKVWRALPSFLCQGFLFPSFCPNQQVSTEGQYRRYRHGREFGDFCGWGAIPVKINKRYGKVNEIEPYFKQEILKDVKKGIKQKLN